MTAPSDATVLFSFVSVFAAATGYAAGRLHQWYRMDSDRDEAYRAGYDTATRSTFSMAARIIGPRRDRAAVRASASVRRSAPASVAEPAPASTGPALTGPASTGPASTGPASTGPASTGSEPAGSAPPPGVFAPVARPVESATDPDSAPPRPAKSRSGRSTGRLPRRGRHLVPEELVNGPTYRLTPDRVARAKVVGATPPEPGEGGAGSRPEVPKPRTS